MGPSDTLKDRAEDVSWKREGWGDTHTGQGLGCTEVMIRELAHGLVVIHSHTEMQKQAVRKPRAPHVLAWRPWEQNLL